MYKRHLIFCVYLCFLPHCYIEYDQFGSRKSHGCLEQVKRLVNHLTHSFESKLYTRLFLDVKQVFDKAWDEGLLYTIKTLVMAPPYYILGSSIIYRVFEGAVGDSRSSMQVIYTGDIMVLSSSTPSVKELVATYADDTAMLASHM